MPNSNWAKTVQLLTATVITFCIYSPSVQAAIIEQNLLELPTTIVRNRLISSGIAVYQRGDYDSAVYLLQNFLSPHRLITTPLEKSAINYLALAYQARGESAQATATIQRAIDVVNNSTLELATAEYNAGIIAALQNEQSIANQHWETARQLYKERQYEREWVKTTLKLVQGHRALGNLPKSRRLLQELKAIEP